MTKEERNERKRCLPYARLDSCGASSGVVVQMDEGSDMLKVAKRGEWERGKINGWQQVLIPMNDPQKLADFIRALVARYNWMIDRLNDTRAASSMKAAERADSTNG